MYFSEQKKWTKRRCFCPFPFPDKKGPHGFSVGDFIQRLGMLAVGDDGVEIVGNGWYDIRVPARKLVFYERDA